MSHDDERSRPDIAVHNPPHGQAPWAIEVQYSPLRPEDVRDRTNRLKRAGFRVIWVAGVQLRFLPDPDSGSDTLARADLEGTFLQNTRAWPDELWVGGQRDNGDYQFARAHSVGWGLEKLKAEGRHPRIPGAVDVNFGWPIALNTDSSKPTLWRCPTTEARLREIEEQAGQRAPDHMRDLARAAAFEAADHGHLVDNPSQSVQAVDISRTQRPTCALPNCDAPRLHLPRYCSYHQQMVDVCNAQLATSPDPRAAAWFPGARQA